MVSRPHDKTRRMIAEQIKNVDAVCEILDARIPVSSRNPDVDELTAGKAPSGGFEPCGSGRPGGDEALGRLFPRQRAMPCWNPTQKTAWARRNLPEPSGNCWQTSSGPMRKKGMTGRVVRVMILGVPNVGKSTFINKVAGRKTAKTEDRPGVTRPSSGCPSTRI